MRSARFSEYVEYCLFNSHSTKVNERTSLVFQCRRYCIYIQGSCYKKLYESKNIIKLHQCANDLRICIVSCESVSKIRTVADNFLITCLVPIVVKD